MLVPSVFRERADKLGGRIGKCEREQFVGVGTRNRAPTLFVAFLCWRLRCEVDYVLRALAEARENLKLVR
jgi:hypothetical protein